jgi:hypothetical protein
LMIGRSVPRKRGCPRTHAPVASLHGIHGDVRMRLASDKDHYFERRFT